MRSLSREARHERRVQVIRLRKVGLTYEAISAQTGLSRTGVFDICQRHERGGAKALHDRKGGPREGEHRLLTDEQERQVQRLIRDKTPDQIRVPYALWSRQAVADLILDQFGIRVAVRTMGTYLKRWGFTPQKPIRRAYEQSPAAVKRWLDTSYPQIAARAKKGPRFTGATRRACARTTCADAVLPPRVTPRWCASIAGERAFRSSRR